MAVRSVWTPKNVTWLAGIAAAAGGLAACLTVLARAAGEIMGLGGAVATGGAYVIESQAPPWALVIPGSILAGFAFGGWSIGLSLRSGGFSLLPLVWSGLFLSLGAVFAIMGFDPPGGQGLAWGWIVCAIVFVPMGLAPHFGLGDMFAGIGWAAPGPKPCQDKLYKTAYLGSVVAGALVGLILGWVGFAVLAQ